MNGASVLISKTKSLNGTELCKSLSIIGNDTKRIPGFQWAMMIFIFFIVAYALPIILKDLQSSGASVLISKTKSLNGTELCKSLSIIGNA
jgi:hypothetical protein